MSSLLIQAFDKQWKQVDNIRDGQPPVTFLDYSSGKKEVYVILCCKNFANIYKFNENVNTQLINNHMAVSPNDLNRMNLVKKLTTNNPCYEQSMKLSEKDKQSFLIGFTYLY